MNIPMRAGRATSEQEIGVLSRSLPRDFSAFLPDPGIAPGKQAHDIYVSSSVAAPAPATQIVLLSYLVGIGHRFSLTGIMYRFDPENLYVPGDGSILWALDVNKPLLAYAQPFAVSGRPLEGFGGENMPIGSFERPWIFPRPRVFQASDLIQLKVTTTNAVAQNSGYFNSRFIGYLWPAED